MRRVAAKHHSIFSSPSAEDVHFASSQGSRLHCNYCALYYTMILYSMPSRFQLLFLLTIVTCSAFTSVLKFPSNGRLGRPIFQSNTEATDVSSSQDEQRTPKPEVRCPDCDLCDGSGRIMGGIGAVVPWIPIKAYRPCPNFIARGGNYERSGQGLDEIAFGRDSTFKK